MLDCKNLISLTLLGVTTAGVPAFAADPPGAPTDSPGSPRSSKQKLVPKNDPHRIVGKVLQIDYTEGTVRLATEDGVLIVQAPPQALQAVKVGDTVSVPRPTTEPPSTSPPR
jgi:hypothetical protein